MGTIIIVALIGTSVYCSLKLGGGGDAPPMFKLRRVAAPPPLVVLEDCFKGVGSLILAKGVGTAITIFHAMKHFN